MLSGRQDALSYVKIIVNAGWSTYPRGYFYGYLLGAVDETLLVVVYNVDDFVNKIAFVLACWSAATAESEEKWRCVVGMCLSPQAGASTLWATLRVPLRSS